MNIFFILAVVLMVLAAFGISPKGVNLWYLGWACALLSFAFPGVFVVHT